MTDPATRFDGGTISVPPGWEVHEDVAPALLVLREPPSGAAFRANVNVTVETVGEDPLSYGRHLEALTRSLDDHQLIDAEACSVAGTPGGARLLSLHTTGGEGLATEQWLSGPLRGMRWILSATCLATTYAVHADRFGQLVEGWHLDGAMPR
jgi:hypothetical protein